MNKETTKAITQEASHIYELFLKYYFTDRNIDKLSTLFSPDITNIGSGSDELAIGINDVMKIFRRDKEQCPEIIKFKQKSIKVVPICDMSGLVIAELDLNTIIDNMPVALHDYRISMVIVQDKNKSLINHLHFSKGEVHLNEGESFPLKEIEERNRVLENIVSERTRELFKLNNELKAANKNILEIKQRFESIFENVNDGILVTDWTNRKFYMLNQKICNILGYSKEELLKLWLIDIIPSEHYADSIKKLQAQYGGKTEIAEELPFLTRAEEVRYFDVNSKAITINNKEYFVSLLRDITAKKATHDLQKEMEISRQASKTKDLFLANISHEIRTPVTGIIGMSEVLGRTKVNEEQSNYIDIIKESSRVLLDIINDLLDIAKIEAGKLEVRNEVFTLNDILNHIKAIYGPRAKKKNIELKLSFLTNLQQKIEADKTRVEQIIMNLMTNAIKYTDTGSIEIIVSDQEIDMFKSEIKIEVKDTGIGIDSKNKQKLFKKFEQLDQSYTRTTSGTGLGLYICKELSKLLGGSIDVESEPGKGSNFWFTFIANKQIPEKQNIPAKGIDYDNIDLGINVLIVDDKLINIKVIKLMLESAGCIVDTAKNGLEAINTFKPDFHQFVFMDIMMPVMDGITAMNKIKEIHKEVPPIVALTANAMEGDAQTYIKKGFTDYLAKPASRNTLINMMLKWQNN
ncbi:MAG: ATP-binding protein [Bacteroidota bacterium]